jgi:hypothetical protein
LSHPSLTRGRCLASAATVRRRYRVACGPLIEQTFESGHESARGIAGLPADPAT